MIYDVSYGIIPLKKYQNGWQVFIVQHKKGNHFGFPKGHANISETEKEAALRELKEETNLEVLRFLAEKPLMEHYTFHENSKIISKKVYYYLAEVKGDFKIDLNEIIDGKWVDINLAKDILTHEASKKIAIQVENILQNL